MGRLIILGDPHGEYVAVQRILDEQNYEPGEDTLVGLGDYCDHFPEEGDARNVRLLIDLLINLQVESPNKVHFILGNHDKWFRNWMNEGELPPEIWWSQGGRETLESYAPLEMLNEAGHLPSGLYGTRMSMEDLYALRVEHIPDSHKMFFDQLPMYYVDDLVVCVHGGMPDTWHSRDIDINLVLNAIKQGKPIWERYRYDVLWDRKFFQGRRHDQRLFYDVFDDHYYFIGGHQVVYQARGDLWLPGPFVSEYNRKWIMVDSPGMHAVVIYDEENYEIVEGRANPSA